VKEQQMFEQATRKKYRFPSAKGELTVEQLWDLPLLGKTTCLDTVARAVNKQLKAVSEEESFVNITGGTIRSTLSAKMDVVKHVIAVKLAERDAAKTRAENASKRQKLLTILDSKQNAKLEGMSEEEILKELAALGS